MEIGDVLREALRRRLAGNSAGAYMLLHSTLATLTNTEQDEKSELFSFVADFYTEDGAIDKAKKFYAEALALSGENSYRRYSLELSLGAICEQSEAMDDLSQWYVAAISTALSDETISAASAVKRLLALRARRLTDDEADLCKRGLDHSWRVLGLTGQPDRTDLFALATMLIDAAAREPS